MENDLAALSPPDDSAVIDWEQTLRLTGGKETLAKEMMALFIRFLPEAEANIQLAYQKGDMTRLQEELHKFLGGCSYCGVPRLKFITTKFEHAVRKKTANETQLAELFRCFNQEVSAMQAAYNEII